MIVGLLTLMLSGPAQAAELADSPEGFGLGIATGQVTGVAAGYRPNDQSAIGGILGWYFMLNSFNVQTDYQLTIVDFQGEEGVDVKLRMSAGGGAFIDVYEGYSGVGIYLPIGFTLLPGQRPFDVFLDIAPGMTLMPNTEFVARGAVGARVYFR